ncbi:hypothetical protein [Caproiciproducens galactitolivorans]|uniref:Uncharacterized protein n=1 Tax=Caproiciproducens galactitolivorans TaxID=642589 RepID=A0ABT4BUC8_9FIRM|nr:hypothetical protein [Caproiciproducens galactitolivorans]MCY1714479.1 hypothetical protein [Caproiciproducens galactitolivorans]
MEEAQNDSDNLVEDGFAFLKLNNECNIENAENKLIFDRLTYIIFCTAILPSDKFGKMALNQLSKLYMSVKDLDGNWFFEPSYENDLNLLYDKMKSFFPLKKGIISVANVLREQLVNDPFRNGIELGVLNRIIDLSKTPYLKEDLPYHSRIGIGYHAGTVANEEQQLLEDSFFMFISAKIAYKNFYKTGLTFKREDKDIKPELTDKLSRLNKNVATFCRNGIINYYSFFESFVNCLGIDYLYDNELKLSEEEKNALRGKNKSGDHYLTMEMKIECLQKIVGGKVIFKTNNPKQLKDLSFQQLLNRFKSERDTSVHFAKGKGEILLAPQKWLKEIQDISVCTLDASKKLWKACYSDRDYPNYLRKLNYDVLYKEAELRLL